MAAKVKGLEGEKPMRAVIQRVQQGSVTVDGEVVGEIGPGLVILLGAGHGDGQAEADRLAAKIANLRIFSDAQGKTNLSILDVGGDALVISQFTLYADCRKGRRPSFVKAAMPDVAEPLVDYFAGQLREAGVERVEKGEFGASMLVEIHNDGPFTIVLDTAELKR
jgi:D-tyrosyl-tRNA(Tyr) deacylase